MYDEVSENIRTLIESVQMPGDIADELREVYRALVERTRSKETVVAVRSSAPSEDLRDASSVAVFQPRWGK